jgi:hypothetical protein
MTFEERGKTRFSPNSPVAPSAILLGLATLASGRGAGCKYGFDRDRSQGPFPLLDCRRAASLPLAGHGPGGTRYPAALDYSRAVGGCGSHVVPKSRAPWDLVHGFRAADGAVASGAYCIAGHLTPETIAQPFACPEIIGVNMDLSPSIQRLRDRDSALYRQIERYRHTPLP